MAYFGVPQAGSSCSFTCCSASEIKRKDVLPRGKPPTPYDVLYQRMPLVTFHNHNNDHYLLLRYFGAGLGEGASSRDAIRTYNKIIPPVLAKFEVEETP